MQPLQCTSTGDINDDTSISSFEKSACERLTNKGKVKDTIGEENLFFPGMSLIDVWGRVTELKPFRLHGDWIFGYFVNFYNISRYTVHSGKNFFDDNFDDLPESRLHAIMPDSEIYRKHTENCRNEDSCHENATVCHHLNSNDMKKVYESFRFSA